MYVFPLNFLQSFTTSVTRKKVFILKKKKPFHWKLSPSTSSGLIFSTKNKNVFAVLVRVQPTTPTMLDVSVKMYISRIGKH